MGRFLHPWEEAALKSEAAGRRRLVLDENSSIQMTLFASSVLPPRVSSHFSPAVCIRFLKPALLIWANIVIPAGKNALSLTVNPISAPSLVHFRWKTFISVGQSISLPA